MTRLYSDSAYDRSLPVGSFWETTVDPHHRSYPPLAQDAICDVAVVGGGYTGLNAALRLAETHGMDVRVLDAGEIGWGASGRNGGFCCRGGSKRALPWLVRRDGLEETRRLVAYQCAAIDHVREVLDSRQIDADTHSEGETCLAHRPRDVDGLREEAEDLRRTFGFATAFHSRDDLAERGLSGPEFFAGMSEPMGFALNPMKYLAGLARTAALAGAGVHGRSPVDSIRREDGRWHLRTPGGSVRAKRLIVATNGYTEEDLSPALAGRLLPTLSSILVTRPLSVAEREAQGWTSAQMCFDTRNLLHYFRLMPDGRFLFGMRGGLNTDPASETEIRAAIHADFKRMFPAWAEVDIEHYWSGLVCLTRDLTAHVGRLGDLPDAWTALGYHGNGVSTGSYSGARLADLCAGSAREHGIPAAFRRPLARFPLPFLRKAYLRGAYAWYGITDR